MPHEGTALIVSPWPQSGRPRDLKALQEFDNLQALVWFIIALNIWMIVIWWYIVELECLRNTQMWTAVAIVQSVEVLLVDYLILTYRELGKQVRSIRNARAEYSVEPAKRISAYIVASPANQPFIEVCPGASVFSPSCVQHQVALQFLHS